MRSTRLDNPNPSDYTSIATLQLHLFCVSLFLIISVPSFDISINPSLTQRAYLPTLPYLPDKTPPHDAGSPAAHPGLYT
ncbi:hypothetical protein HYQ46_005990 [Verticillium longisporum]|nr:hypothetical protein HYQ46_005990 [Verticillium longisporum]